jgi:hypothetical protein
MENDSAVVPEGSVRLPCGHAKTEDDLDAQSSRCHRAGPPIGLPSPAARYRGTP